MADSGTGKEWQFLMKNIKERLQYMYTSEEYSDLDIVFPKYELTFKAHRVILSMSSSVFGTMLMGPLATGKELILPKDSPHAFQKLLDHIYVDQMDLESVKQALEVYALAPTSTGCTLQGRLVCSTLSLT
ncbi:BTB/POZ domain-containing protein 6-B-like isoform X1 [Oratosquilla oratoria]|uniref:BTB/POZ domain-containing protein 6-B-like isoform X1 n=1 Tax=Oratosquilla oratoria TaxID=337810 RepID=UPI003F75A7DD